MKEIWSKEEAEYHGEFVNFDPMIARPKPVQKPHPPIHVGGAFPYGARRAIRYGDGWIPTARGDVADVLPKFREMAREAGRDPAAIEITSFGLGEDLDRVKRLAEIGVARVVSMFPPAKADTVLPIVDRWTKIMQQANIVIKIKRKIPVATPHPPSLAAGSPLSRGAGEGLAVAHRTAPRPHCGRGCRAKRGG